MWVRDAWYVAVWSHEVPGDGVVARTIMNEPLLLNRTSNGSVVTMEDRCCHRLAPLSLGRREGDDAANYPLINDNLLDLSRIAFADEKTLGRGTPRWAAEQPVPIRLDAGSRFQRWFRGRGPSHYFGDLGERCDMWHFHDFLVPGLFIQRPAWYPLGTADRYEGNAPAEEPLFIRCDDQAVNPVTATTPVISTPREGGRRMPARTSRGTSSGSRNLPSMRTKSSLRRGKSDRPGSIAADVVPVDGSRTELVPRRRAGADQGGSFNGRWRGNRARRIMCLCEGDEKWLIT